MASTDVVSHHTEPYACPFFKSDPAIWVENKSCLSYRSHDVKEVLLRHHVLDTHLKLNDKFGVGDVHYVDPQLFDEIRYWLRTSGRRNDDYAIWMHVYGMIRGDADEGAALPDPYWTLPWLHRVLGRLVEHDIGINWDGNIKLSGLKQRIQTIESMVSHAVQDYVSGLDTFKEIETQLYSLKMAFIDMEQTQTSNHSSFASTQIADSQETQETGMMFSDHHDQTATNMDAEMAGFSAEHADNMPQDWSIRPWASNPTIPSFPPYSQFHEGFVPMQHGDGLAPNHTSTQTTSAATPPSSSICHSSQFFEE